MRSQFLLMIFMGSASCVWLPALIISGPELPLFLWVYAAFISVAVIFAWIFWPRKRRTPSRMAICGLSVVLSRFVIYGSMIGIVISDDTSISLNVDPSLWLLEHIKAAGAGIVLTTLGGTLLTLGFPWFLAVMISKPFADRVEGLGPLSGKWIKSETK